MEPKLVTKNSSTSARLEYDFQTAQLICSHSSNSTIERFFAEQNISRVVTYAAEFG